MIATEHFKPYGPDPHAVVRLDTALPPDHLVHVFVDLIRSISLDHFVVNAWSEGREALPSPRAVRAAGLGLPARGAFLAQSGAARPAGGDVRLPRWRAIFARTSLPQRQLRRNGRGEPLNVDHRHETANPETIHHRVVVCAKRGLPQLRAILQSERLNGTALMRGSGLAGSGSRDRRRCWCPVGGR